MSNEFQETLFPVEQDIQPAKFKDHTKVPMELIRQVFDYWVLTVRNSGRGMKPRLDNKRKNSIAKAIAMFDVDTCMDAVRGCLLSDWHMGNNPQGKRYDEISLILRDAAQIEKFVNLAANEKTGWEYEQD